MRLSNSNAGIIERLQASQDPDFINASLLGMVAGKHPYPLFLPEPYWENHFWCMGATRCGKTARFMYPLAAQRLERNDGPLVYADLKGEDWLFHALKKSGGAGTKVSLGLERCLPLDLPVQSACPKLL